jgi:Tol biopolymer transport system component
MSPYIKRILLSALAATSAAAVLPAVAPAQRVPELVTAGNGAFNVSDLQMSDDGSRVVFRTAERLVASDTDTKQDIYERAGGRTTLVSAGGNGMSDADLRHLAPDGSRVTFSTRDALTADDTNAESDVYRWSGGQVQLISVGSGALGAGYAGASPDGSRVYFTTQASLDAADTDAMVDVYERSGGRTIFVSPGGNGTHAVRFAGASADGSRVFLETFDVLGAGDLDTHQDVFERTGTRTSLLSVGNGPPSAQFVGASADGSRVFISTREALLPGDTDADIDIYERWAEQTTLLSPGGSGSGDVYFAGASEDGTRVFLSTAVGLASSDTDGRYDVYESSGGQLALVSAGGNAPIDSWSRGIARDGSRVVFATHERLVAADTDSQQDLYERSGGQTTLVSAGGNADHPAFFQGMSADASRVLFLTSERLASEDKDSESDIYERAAGRTELVTGAGNGPHATAYADASADGNLVLFYTSESLVTTDRDADVDGYAARIGGPGATGGAGRRGSGSAADDAAPSITRASLTRRRFAARRAASGRRVGTAFRFVLSEKANVRISVRRSRSRTKSLGALTVRGTRGPNRKGFSGRLRGRPLSAGRYVATLTATDVAGNRSRPVTVRFTVVRNRRGR